MWNWNGKNLESSENAIILLIEPMWNWNLIARITFRIDESAFNWTNVELKLEIEEEGEKNKYIF